MSKCFVYVLLLCALVETACNKSKSPHPKQEKSARAETEFLNGGIPPVIDSAFSGTHFTWLVTGEGDLLRTSDGGMKWEKIAKEDVNWFRSISFSDAQNGWALNYEAEVWRTTDAGQSWRQISNLSPNQELFLQNQIGFMDDLHGWIADISSIWRTEDGGYNWQRYEPSANADKVKELMHGFYFIDAESGWLGAGYGAIYRTTDGGKTWRGQYVTSRGTEVKGIFFMNRRIGWLAAMGWDNKSDTPINEIYRTHDGGETWHQEQVPVQNISMASIQFVNDNEGWSLGNESIKGGPTRYSSRGVVLHTIDGGRSWQRVQMNEEQLSYNRIYFSDREHGWLLASAENEDTLYRTEDGGAHWNTILKLPAIPKPESD